MKNIHLLPTDTVTNLYVFEGKLHFSKSPQLVNCRNIYITSNEEIKEEDWYHDEIIGINKKISDLKSPKLDRQKIILTTDQDLIKDGVQAIDDEFLEWFVENPSCESVKFNAYPIGPNGNLIATNYPYPFKGLISNFEIEYKIIIPKEEPKQETLEEAAKKQDYTLGVEYCAFIEGAKWQAERMYSKEEVLEILEHHTSYLQTFISQYIDRNDMKENDEWFEQFKKK